MVEERQIVYFLDTNIRNRSREDFAVNVMIQAVPFRLLDEFTRLVVREDYPDGMSSAIKAIMSSAVRQAKEKQVALSV